MYAEDGALLGEYGSGGSASSGTAQYLYLPTASGPMPIAAVIKGQTYAVHSDHLNTPRKLTQADGQAAWQWEYSAFGDEQPTIGAKRFTSETTTPTTGATSIPEVTFNLRYPGQYFDQETKLHYNYFRSYDSRTGRYTQGDPIGLQGGNRFTYVGGNPLAAIDPDGLYDRFRNPLDLIPLEGGGGGGLGGGPTVGAPSPFGGGGRGGASGSRGGSGTSSAGGVKPVPIPVPIKLPNDDCLDCEAERQHCAILCSDIYEDRSDNRRGVYGGSLAQCISNCLPEACGGEPRWKGWLKK